MPSDSVERRGRAVERSRTIATTLGPRTPASHGHGSKPRTPREHPNPSNPHYRLKWVVHLPQNGFEPYPHLLRNPSKDQLTLRGPRAPLVSRPAPQLFSDPGRKREPFLGKVGPPKKGKKGATEQLRSQKLAAALYKGMNPEAFGPLKGNHQLDGL